MTSECHNSYRESAELMQVCGASTTPRRSNRLRSTASRHAPTASNETRLNETGTDLFAKLEEALNRVSKLESDLSEKDRAISKKDSEIQDLQNWRNCKVCMQEEVDQVFIPCGHVICCKICITQLQTCPICRKPIVDTL